jgi:2-(1,2-epoxy-1,2-dihydrophenyl)acetyl-CoA isomerase
VEGGATGAGLSLVLACDLIFAARDAQFTASYVRAGLVPDGGLTASLARAVPRQLAMEMCLFAQPVEAVRLAELGVVTEAVAAGDALEAALAAVDRLAKGPSAAQRVIRGLAAQAQEASFDIMLDAERDAMARAQGGDEAAEGIASFLEKRPANFR